MFLRTRKQWRCYGIGEGDEEIPHIRDADTLSGEYRDHNAKLEIKSELSLCSMTVTGPVNSTEF